MFKKILNLFSKTKKLDVGKNLTHATFEHIVIKEDGKTESFSIGITRHGKNSDLPQNERKPQTIIEFEESKLALMDDLGDKSSFNGKELNQLRDMASIKNAKKK